MPRAMKRCLWIRRTMKGRECSFWAEVSYPQQHRTTTEMLTVHTTIGNAGYETADHIVSSTAFIHMASRYCIVLM